MFGHVLRCKVQYAGCLCYEVPWFMYDFSANWTKYHVVPRGLLYIINNVVGIGVHHVHLFQHVWNPVN